jgi:hypothetical protein
MHASSLVSPLQDSLGTGVARCGVDCGIPGVMEPLRCAPCPTSAPGLDGLPSPNEWHGFIMRGRRYGEVVMRENTPAGPHAGQSPSLDSLNL